MDRFYRIGPRSAADALNDLGPPPPADHKWHGVRDFWRKTFAGQHLADYEAAYSVGKAELDSDTFAYLDTLDAVEKHLRDDSWQAKLDGYTDATKDVRGPNKLKPF